WHLALHVAGTDQGRTAVGCDRCVRVRAVALRNAGGQRAGQARTGPDYTSDRDPRRHLGTGLEGSAGGSGGPDPALRAERSVRAAGDGGGAGGIKTFAASTCERSW